jgi:hypothetical protein
VPGTLMGEGRWKGRFVGGNGNADGDGVAIVGVSGDDCDSVLGVGSLAEAMEKLKPLLMLSCPGGLGNMDGEGEAKAMLSVDEEGKPMFIDSRGFAWKAGLTIVK